MSESEEMIACLQALTEASISLNRILGEIERKIESVDELLEKVWSALAQLEEKYGVVVGGEETVLLPELPESAQESEPKGALDT